MTGAQVQAFISATAGAIACLVFAQAVFHKLTDFGAFAGSLADYRIVPRATVGLVARALVAGEICVVVGVNVPWVRTASATLACGLLIVYASAIAISIGSGRREIQCGCGGPAQSLSWYLVGRNGVLCAVTVAAAVLDSYPVSGLEGAVVVASAVLLWSGYALVEMVHRNSRYLKAVGTARRSW